MLLDADDSQLLLVGWQTGLLAEVADAGGVLAQARRLAAIAGLLSVPVWAVELDDLGSFDAELQRAAGRSVSSASFNGCDTGLMTLLRPPAKPVSGNARSLPKHLQRPAAESLPGRQQVVLAGCEAHVAVLQTALGLLDETFDTWVVTDACGSRRERDRDAAYDRLAGAGIELVTTEMVAFEWLGGSRHPAYRDVLALLR